jgi:hypothetical protein
MNQDLILWGGGGEGVSPPQHEPSGPLIAHRLLPKVVDIVQQIILLSR